MVAGGAIVLLQDDELGVAGGARIDRDAPRRSSSGDWRLKLFPARNHVHIISTRAHPRRDRSHVERMFWNKLQRGRDTRSGAEMS